MNTAITAADLRDRLPEVLAALKPGERIVIDQGGQTFTLAADARAEPAPFREPFIAQRHWDAIPACYVGGGVLGLAAHAVGWSPVLGFGVGFVAVAMILAAAFVALRHELDDARQ